MPIKVRVVRDGKVAQESEIDVGKDPAGSSNEYKYKVRKKSGQMEGISEDLKRIMFKQWQAEQKEAGTEGKYQYNEQHMYNALQKKFTKSKEK